MGILHVIVAQCILPIKSVHTTQSVGASEKASNQIVAPQITIKASNGVRTRIDYVTKNGDKIACIECKASVTAKLTPNQEKAFPDIIQNGGVVMGKGKEGFPGGTIIPPNTPLVIRRP